jgi:hypothetical protein
VSWGKEGGVYEEPHHGNERWRGDTVWSGSALQLRWWNMLQRHGVSGVERQRQGTKWRWGTMGVPTTPFIGPRREEIGREVKGNNGW